MTNDLLNLQSQDCKQEFWLNFKCAQMQQSLKNVYTHTIAKSACTSCWGGGWWNSVRGTLTRYTSLAFLLTYRNDTCTIRTNSKCAQMHQTLKNSNSHTITKSTCTSSVGSGEMVSIFRHLIKITGSCLRDSKELQMLSYAPPKKLIYLLI